MPRRTRDDRTGDLFAYPRPAVQQPGAYDYRDVVSHLVSEILEEADVNRFEVAARVSQLTGREISKYMLDAYSAESREGHNFPFSLAPALEAACRTYRLTHWLVDIRGGELLVGREALDAELGRIEKQKETLNRRARQLRRELGEDQETQGAVPIHGRRDQEGS